MSFASDDARRALVSVLDALESAGIDHYLTGALVRNLLGSARTTEDFDIVVDDWAHPPAEIRRILEAAGFTVDGPLTGNLGTRFVIEPGGFETDIWLPPDTEVHRGEMARRQMLEWHGRLVPVMGSEDFVLRKVVTFRLRRKTTDLDDAYQVLMVAWDTIDRSRLVQRASFYRVEKLMEELIEVAREDRAALAGGQGREV